MDEQEFVTTMEQLRSGDHDLRNQAAERVLNQYVHRLIRLIRENLHTKLQNRIDPEDVMQSMYKSFCARQLQGDFHFNSQDDLWNLLVTLTLRKTRNIAKFHTAKKRHYQREVPAGTFGEELNSTAFFEELASREPTPMEAALFQEALETRLGSLPCSQLKTVALLKLEGFSNQEIAGELNLTVRAIERKLNRIRAEWEHQHRTPAPESNETE